MVRRSWIAVSLPTSHCYLDAPTGSRFPRMRRLARWVIVVRRYQRVEFPDTRTADRELRLPDLDHLFDLEPELGADRAPLIRTTSFKGPSGLPLGVAGSYPNLGDTRVQAFGPLFCGTQRGIPAGSEFDGPLGVAKKQQNFALAAAAESQFGNGSEFPTTSEQLPMAREPHRTRPHRVLLDSAPDEHDRRLRV
jgi:hypothetical protein